MFFHRNIGYRMPESHLKLNFWCFFTITLIVGCWNHFWSEVFNVFFILTWLLEAGITFEVKFLMFFHYKTYYRMPESLLKLNFRCFFIITLIVPRMPESLLKLNFQCFFTIKLNIGCWNHFWSEVFKGFFSL
jgi:hypothetical protein